MSCTTAVSWRYFTCHYTASCGIKSGIAPRQQHIITFVHHRQCSWLSALDTLMLVTFHTWALAWTAGCWDAHLYSHAVHTAATECCFDQLDEGTIFITVHALIPAGRNPCHCMAPQSLSKQTLPPCLPAAPPSPPSASQLCLLKASLTQLSRAHYSLPRPPCSGAHHGKKTTGQGRQ